MFPKFIIQHHTTSGWEEAPGFCLHDTLPGALHELSEFLMDIHEAYGLGHISEPYSTNDYRITQGDNVVAHFGPAIGQI
jgi:hypothetical protein